MSYRLKKGIFLFTAFMFVVGGGVGLPSVSSAVQPDAKTVPWVAGNPLIPHDTWSGKQITLKGTSDVQGANIQYTWDFGDGSPVATGPVTNQYVIEATHIYTGSTGTVVTAILTVEDTNTSETDTAQYFIQIEDQTLEVEVNVAIDEGLWYLHKTMNRFNSGGLDEGDWLQSTSCGARCASSTWYATTPANLNAFFVNGHLETGAASNPYTETVRRGMRRLFELLGTIAISDQTYPAPIGTVNPDSNGNGLGVNNLASQGYEGYQTGIFVDAVVASGTPGAVVQTGPLAGLDSPSTPGADAAYNYFDAVQDMVDAIAFGQGHAGTYYGGWRYSWNYGCNSCNSDNSTNQWNAIGLIAAEQQFGATVPVWVKQANINSVNQTQTTSGSEEGQFGYTNSPSPIWGPYAVTPSGMVQMAMDGIGRGDVRWDRSENFMRDRFCNASGNATTAIRSYYYGLFSFTKSMLLHDPDGNGVPNPIVELRNQPGGANPLDWYGAQASAGDECDGVARTLVNSQNAAGYWYQHNYDGNQFPFETAWAIIMLNRTVFASGVPVAVAQAVPNPGVAGQSIVLDGSASFSQDPSKIIVMWEWDTDKDGTFDMSGPVVTTSYPAVGDYPVTLRVTDNAADTDDTVITVRITTPPIAPTADADGPYVFCPQAQPWFLNGTGSVNPDEGQSEPGQPGDTIQEYAWDLDGDGQFDDASGAQPDVTAFFTALGVGDYLIQLRVTDTTATSFPSSGMGDLSDIDSAQVSVKDAADPACAGCTDDLTARPKYRKVQLVWTDTGAASYHVYRGTIMDGPYTFIANTTSTYSTYLDTDVVNGTTYYYVVRPAQLNGGEICQSNEVSATPTARVRR